MKRIMERHLPRGPSGQSSSCLAFLGNFEVDGFLNHARFVNDFSSKFQTSVPETNSEFTPEKWMVGIRGRFLLGWPIFRGKLLVSGSANWTGFLLRSFFCPKFCRCITPLKINIEPENRGPREKEVP